MLPLWVVVSWDESGRPMRGGVLGMGRAPVTWRKPHQTFPGTFSAQPILAVGVPL